MAKQPEDLIFCKPVSLVEGGYPGFHPRTVKTQGMVIEYDVTVSMRDGVKIYADVYRPDRPGRYPPLIQWGPYGKHGRVLYCPLGEHRALRRGLQRVHQVRGGRPGLLVPEWLRDHQCRPSRRLVVARAT